MSLVHDQDQACSGRRPECGGYRTGVEAVVFLAVLAAGYGLEPAVATRTGRRVLR